MPKQKDLFKLPLFSPIMVIWADSTGSDGWTDMTTLKEMEPKLCLTIGQFLSVDDLSIRVLLTRIRNHVGLASITIPISTVVACHQIQDKKLEKLVKVYEGGCE